MRILIVGAAVVTTALIVINIIGSAVWELADQMPLWWNCECGGEGGCPKGERQE